MIQSGIVTKQVTLAENVQVNMDFEEAVNILSMYTAIEDKGIQSLFNEESIESFTKLIVCLSEAVDNYNTEFENGQLIDEGCENED